jgi:hypothetical protein
MNRIVELRAVSKLSYFFWYTLYTGTITADKHAHTYMPEAKMAEIEARFVGIKHAWFLRGLSHEESEQQKAYVCKVCIHWTKKFRGFYLKCIRFLNSFNNNSNTKYISW